MIRLASSRAPVSELSSEERVDRSAPAAPALATSSPADATTPSSWALSSDRWFDICAAHRLQVPEGAQLGGKFRLAAFEPGTVRAASLQQFGLDLLE